jgi:AcrR family transcriptional regulator
MRQITDEHSGDRSRSTTISTDPEEAALIEAAYRGLARDGAEGVSMRQILGTAGIGTRAFYRHFSSKDDLLLAMFRRDSQRVTEELATRVAAAPDPSSALEAWIDHTLAICYDPRRFRRVRVMMSAEVRRTPGYLREQTAVSDAHRALLVDILLRGRQDGTLADAEPEFDARAIQAMTNRLVEERSNDIESYSWREARAHVLGFARRALGATS